MDGRGHAQKGAKDQARNDFLQGHKCVFRDHFAAVDQGVGHSQGRGQDEMGRSGDPDERLPQPKPDGEGGQYIALSHAAWTSRRWAKSADWQARVSGASMARIGGVLGAGQGVAPCADITKI